MADSKITALTAISTVDPAADPLVIVDVSDTSMAASGTTKKATINQLLGASGTATLASATITGDLTVRTNKLAVTSTSVGIGTASPTIAAGVGLEIENAGITTLRLQNTSGANAFELQVDSDANGVLYRGYNNSPHVFYVNNSTAMTLNSTGLGIGVTPSAWPAASKAIDVVSYGANYAIAAATQVGISRNCYYNGTNWIYKLTTSAQRFEQDNGGGFKWFTAAAGTAGTAVTFTQSMTLDASGNLILQSSATPATLTTNGQLTVNATSNTNLRFSYRGSDGVTRVANITLA